MSTPHVTVIVPAELADGYRLAGVHTEQAETVTAAGEALEQLIGGTGQPGVVAVYPRTWASWAGAGNAGSASWTAPWSSRCRKARPMARLSQPARACATCRPERSATSSPSTRWEAAGEHP